MSVALMAAPEPPAGTIAVVPMAGTHLDAVVALEAEVATTGWSRRIFERELAAGDDGRCYLVAERREPGSAPPVVVGYAGMQVQVDEAHVTTLTVAPTHRRAGVARRLLVALLRAARARGATAATLEVRVDNMPARRLYAAFGFRPVGIRPGYYASTADALIMWAHDVDGDEFDRVLRAQAGTTGPTRREG